MRAAVLLAAMAAAAPPAGWAQAPAPASAWRTPDPANTLVIETTKGRVVLELLPQVAPLAVARIKTLTRRGYYDGALFYRVMKGYMAQTGDKGARTFRSDLPNLKAEFTFRRTPETPFVATGDVAGGEVGFIGSQPVQVEASGQAWAIYCPGTAAMPHYADPDSANSQFFLMRSRAPSLEKAFTAFGRVVQGQEAVDAIQDGEPPPRPDRMTSVRIMADIPAAQRPDIRLVDPSSPEMAARVKAAMDKGGTNFSLCDVPLLAGG